MSGGIVGWEEGREGVDGMGWVKALAISDLPFFFKNFFEIFTPRNIVGMVDYGGEYIFVWVLGVLGIMI